MFLQRLDAEYKNETKRPAIVLSDGCYGLEESNADDGSNFGAKFRIYTAASIDISECRNGAQEALSQPNKPTYKYLYEKESKLIKEDGSLAPFIYGYDAMLIFAKAFNKCESKQDISRKCISDELRSENETDRFPGS